MFQREHELKKKKVCSQNYNNSFAIFIYLCQSFFFFFPCMNYNRVKLILKFSVQKIVKFNGNTVDFDLFELLHCKY